MTGWLTLGLIGLGFSLVEMSLTEVTVCALQMSLSEAASRFSAVIAVVDGDQPTFTLAESSAVLRSAAEAVGNVAVAVDNAAAATIGPMVAAGLDAQDPVLRRPAGMAHFAYRRADGAHRNSPGVLIEFPHL